MLKKVHFAARIKDNGDVSALCYHTPFKICLKRASWTSIPERVTCKECVVALRGRADVGLTSKVA